MKKMVALLLALMMVVACMPALAEWPEGYPEVVEGIDFGGQTIYIYDYWTADDTRKDDPSEEEQAQYDYRDWIMETYNCEIRQIQKGDWTTNVQELTNFCTSPDGTLCLYILPPDFVGTPMGNDLFAAWESENIDFEDDKWNDSTINFMTKGGKVYGVATGNSEPRQCLFFNKRVLEEAGIDWETIYDMQADGTWTWEAFEEMLIQITKDTDNDGVIDIYGMTGNNSDMFMMGVVSNGGEFFRFNDEGKLEIAVNSDAALEGLAWTKDVFAKYFYQQPADGSWDYFKAAWLQGFCGFYMYQTYGGFNDNSELAPMEDEWGCVAFPKGPKGDKYVSIVSDNVTVIPNVYEADVAADLAYIYDLWSNATPGYDDEFAWIGNKYNFTDDRAVDETYAMLREPEHCVANAALYIGSVNDVLGSPLLWQLAGGTPAELVEAATPAWQALCDAFNGVAAE
ncbi:MAG: hypothetical protein IKT57_06630 [Clostridia bacterium]|nr:hypothetical protein [Clostridia bacterium]